MKATITTKHGIVTAIDVFNVEIDSGALVVETRHGTLAFAPREWESVETVESED